jgi:hypothetical protein
MRHAGQKPYKCPFCPYATIQSATYKNHVQVRFDPSTFCLFFTWIPAQLKGLFWLFVMCLGLILYFLIMKHTNIEHRVNLSKCC